MPRIHTTTEHSLRWDLTIDAGETIDLFSRAPTEPGEIKTYPGFGSAGALGLAKYSKTEWGPEYGTWVIADLLPDADDVLVRFWIGGKPFDYDGIFLRREHERRRHGGEAQTIRPLIISPGHRLAIEVLLAGRGKCVPCVFRMRWLHSHDG